MKKTGAEAVRWNLKDLFKSPQDPQIEKILDDVVAKSKSFQKKHKGKLVDYTAEALNKAYIELEALLSPLYKVSQFMSLTYATDTSSDEIKAKVAKIDDIESEVSNLLVFFGLELATISAKKLAELKKNKAISNYIYNIEHGVKTAAHNLSEKEEQIINLKDVTGSDAFQKLYTELVSDFKFEFKLDGKKRIMSGGELRALRQHPKADVRRSAMQTFYKRYEENQIILTHIYNNVVKDFNIERKLRGYSSAISIRNSNQDLDDKAVQALHDVTTESYRLVQRYYKLKSKLVKLPKLTLADIYAPMPKSDKFFTFKEGKDLVLRGFKAFDDDFYSYAKVMFDEKRIDAPVASQKRDGGFCSGSTPDVKPYILLNYLGQTGDVATMAHELGHAIHDMLASKQTLTNYHPILPLAETASVFSEMIITDMLLKEETQKAAKIEILTDKLEDVFATSHRQNMFSRFEMQTHERISESLMSTKELCELYHSELKLMFGTSVQITPEYRWEWATIPHIVEYPFYVYSYNFGNLLVMALYQQYLEEGAPFIVKLKEFLSLGSSKSPKECLAVVNADITKPEFWKKSIRYIESLVVQLEQLVG